MEIEQPVLLAEPINKNQVKVWCPHCLKNHYHGNTEGSRVAHCEKKTNSPFVATGYYIKLK
ncbi:hypothetical protein LMF32_05445 [Desemzia sp. C1]|uniref:hypothetical protein n=1 Tax=Desemzia sp. C1 TaxID=2892016 RepID=UPI001E54FA3C|nr:hypothetical protein [Desemzia sp. C1]MCI3028544.1 hypothetical protein [Desemzia sp. C1]